MAAKIKTGSVLSGFSTNPISYETGETHVLRGQITGSKASKSIEPNPAAKKPIPAVKRAPGAGRTF